MSKSLFEWLALLVSLAVAVPLVLGFFGSVHPAFDSLAHFRAHLAVLICLTAIWLFAASTTSNAAVALLLGAGAFCTTLSMSFLPSVGEVQAARSADATQPGYKLLQLNLYHSNATPEKAIALIERVQPDVITLDEVSALWDDKLGELKATYPHQIGCRLRGYGTAILSRHPFALDTIPQCFDRGSLALAKIDFDGVRVDIAALHLGWPWPYDQHAQLDQLDDELALISAPALLAGDFNATPWSYTTRRVTEMSDMTAVPGIGRTWIEFAFPRWLKFAGLQIDHVLTKGGIIVHSAKTLESVGSDHWPVLVEFSTNAYGSPSHIFE